jgi:hypothetical protein
MTPFSIPRLKFIVATLLFALTFSVGHAVAAQLIGEPPIPAKVKKDRKRHQQADLEWMWQYGPPPAEGREHDLIQDSHWRPFLEEYFTAPQSFWGPGSESKDQNPKDREHKSLADTVDDFMTIPGRVMADDNRYVTVTGAVRHFPTSRGLIFADLDNPSPLVVFAAVDWIRDSKTLDDPGAEYTLWLFANEPPGPSIHPTGLPPALTRSLVRWLAQPLAGSGIVQHINAAILVLPDGAPQQIPVPGLDNAGAPASDNGPALSKRPQP